MEEAKSEIKIEGNVATWELSAVGNIMGTYHGTFRFRTFLTPLQQISAGKEERDLIGPNMALSPEHERFLCYALTQLKYRIISAPPFWNTGGSIHGDIPDEEIISKVLTAAIDAEAQYKTEIKERKEKAILRARKASEEITKADLSLKEENEALEKE